MPSPILRPLGRRREEEEQREIEGAGEAVSGLNLGCQSAIFTPVRQQELIYSIIGQIPNFLNQMNRPLRKTRRKKKFTSSNFLFLATCDIIPLVLLVIDEYFEYYIVYFSVALCNV